MQWEQYLKETKTDFENLVLEDESHVELNETNIFEFVNAVEQKTEEINPLSAKFSSKQLKILVNKYVDLTKVNEWFSTMWDKHSDACTHIDCSELQAENNVEDILTDERFFVDAIKRFGDKYEHADAIELDYIARYIALDSQYYELKQHFVSLIQEWFVDVGVNNFRQENGGLKPVHLS